MTFDSFIKSGFGSLAAFGFAFFGMLGFFVGARLFGYEVVPKVLNGQGDIILNRANAEVLIDGRNAENTFVFENGNRTHIVFEAEADRVDGDVLTVDRKIKDVLLPHGNQREVYFSRVLLITDMATGGKPMRLILGEDPELVFGERGFGFVTLNKHRIEVRYLPE